jgi:hypothetical protein
MRSTSALQGTSATKCESIPKTWTGELVIDKGLRREGTHRIWVPLCLGGGLHACSDQQTHSSLSGWRWRRWRSSRACRVEWAARWRAGWCSSLYREWGSRSGKCTTTPSPRCACKQSPPARSRTGHENYKGRCAASKENFVGDAVASFTQNQIRRKTSHKLERKTKRNWK